MHKQREQNIPVGLQLHASKANDESFTGVRTLTKWPRKPVFPALYLAVFSWTVMSAVYNFILQEPPVLINSTIGAENKSAIVFFTNVMAGLLGLYTVSNYIALEYFEHSGFFSAKRNPIPVWARVLELLIRTLAVSVVGLKLVKWGYFDDIFFFLMVVSLLLSAWHIYGHFLLSIQHFRTELVLVHVPIALLAIGAFWITSEPQRQVELSMWVFALEVVAITLLALANILVFWNVGPNCITVARDYLTAWHLPEGDVAGH